MTQRPDPGRGAGSASRCTCAATADRRAPAAARRRVTTITHWSIYKRGTVLGAPCERIALVPDDQAITTLVEQGMEPNAARAVVERGMSITIGELSVIATII